ncbi:MAG: transposase [Lentisphaerae bacterium]|nr:transposase [Lentisphaerota bacterium]
MRVARILGEGEAFYHIVSRIVDRRLVLNDGEKERFRKLMRAVEAFSGCQILTWAVLDNHWHIALRVPQPEPVSDQDLIHRLAYLYEQPVVAHVAAELADLRAKGLHASAEELKARYTRRMYNLSEFVKTLKQRFTMSYNRRHGRQGTLWESRFKSVLFEGSRRALWTLAAYIDLNAVRARIVDDPQQYRFCGYGEATAGVKVAREGLIRVMQSLDESIATWSRLGRHYRRLLYDHGEKEPGRHRGGIDPVRVEAVLASGGRLTTGEAVHCRVRYFSDGMILGSPTFVDDLFQRYRSNFGVKRKTGARAMRGAQWNGLFCARRLQLDPIQPAGVR